MGLFGKNDGKRNQQPPQKDSFDEKVEKIKSEMGLSHIYGEENQRSFDLIVEQMCRLQEMKENTTQHSEDDLSYIMMKQQEVIIEQNYVMIRLLEMIRYETTRRL